MVLLPAARRVHRSLLKISRRAGRGLLEMPGKRAWPWWVMVMRGIVGEIMGREVAPCLPSWLEELPAQERPPTFLEAGAELAGGGGRWLCCPSHPGVGIWQSCHHQKQTLRLRPAPVCGVCPSIMHVLLHRKRMIHNTHIFNVSQTALHTQ